MLIKPVYDAYLKRFQNHVIGSFDHLFNSHHFYSLLTPLDFLRLPFQVRLALSGAYLELHTPERFSLKERKMLVPDLPEIAFSPGSDSNLSWNDVFIIVNGEYWMLFPFEYSIVFE